MRQPVNVEMLLVAYLRAHAAVAALVGTRVSTALPDPAVYPLVIVRRIAGSTRDVGHLDQARVQIECWADKTKRPDAATLFDVVRGAMGDDEIRGGYTLGVVSGTEEVNALYLEDPVSGRPRYLVDSRVFVHPN